MGGRREGTVSKHISPLLFLVPMLLQPVARNGTSEAKVGDFVVFTWEGHFWKLPQKISENTQHCHLNLSFTLDSYQLVSARLHHKLLWSTIWDANIAKGWPNLQTACLFQSFCCNSFSDKDCAIRLWANRLCCNFCSAGWSWAKSCEISSADPRVNQQNCATVVVQTCSKSILVGCC